VHINTNIGIHQQDIFLNFEKYDSYVKVIREVYAKVIREVYVKVIREVYVKVIREIYVKVIREVYVKVIREVYVKVIREVNSRHLFHTVLSPLLLGVWTLP